MANVKNMDIYEIKFLLAVNVGSEELVLKNTVDLLIKEFNGNKDR